MTDQLEQMQRLQLAGTLAGGIAHDLNNQLMLVLGNLEVALAQLPAGEEVSDSLEQAKSAARRCADMSRRLLTVSRDRGTKMIKMDVESSILEARTLLECIRPPKVRVSSETETGLFIEGNPIQIQQALLELGTNGFDAMAQGGDLEIRASRREDSVIVWVRDTGCGMTPALQKRIFEPFYTTHGENGGNGLGLATVRSIISSHDGVVGIESSVGKGTIFMMTLPAWKETLPVPPTSLR